MASSTRPDDPLVTGTQPDLPDMEDTIDLDELRRLLDWERFLAELADTA
jgi:hypothetical protein